MDMEKLEIKRKSAKKTEKIYVFRQIVSKIVVQKIQYVIIIHIKGKDKE